MLKEGTNEQTSSESEDGTDQNCNSALISPSTIDVSQYERECIINKGTAGELICRGYKKDWIKSALSLCGVICSGGFLLLIFYWRPDWKLKCTTSCCTINSATSVLLLATDGTNQVFVSSIREMSSDLAFLLANSYPRQIDHTQDNIEKDTHAYGTGSCSRSVIYFKHQLLKFIWDYKEQTFVELGGLDGIASLGQLHQNCGDCLATTDVKLRSDLYGPNLITVQIPSYLQLLVFEILNPFYIFQLFAVVFWMFDEYYVYATAIFVVSFISAIVSLIQVRKERVRLHDMVHYHSEIKSDVLRREVEGLKQREVWSRELVPGDVIVIPPGGVQLSCDAVLISGTCIVNESMLTGESVPVTKTPLPSSESEVRQTYDLEQHKRHTLFCGTEVMQTRFYRGELVKAVVVRSGFQTAKGRLVHSILFPKPVDMKLLRDAYRFVGVLFLMAMCGFIYTIVIQVQAGESARDIAFNAIDLITISVPPALPLAMTVGIIYAQLRLKKQRIHCISPQRINVSGQVDVVAFDKTGTLTEDGLDLHDVLPVNHRRHTSTESNCSKFLSAIQPRNIVQDLTVDSEFLHCMATCHTLTEIDGKLAGDPLDLKMFQATDFQLVEPQVEDEARYDQLQATYVRPSQQLLEKLTEKQNSASIMDSMELHTSNEDNIQSRTSSYDIGIVRQFPFSSTLQRASVIVKPYRSRAKDMIVYMKGAPEMVVRLCKENTVPSDFQEVLTAYTQQGFRMIGLAYKPLTCSWLKAQKIERQAVECDTIFLGLVALENKLKPESAGALRKLKDANIRSLMVTGDNILTSLSVARESGMIQAHDTVLLAQTTPQLGSRPATLTWIATEENKDFTHASFTSSFSTEEKVLEKHTVAICMGDQVPHPRSWHLAVTGENFAVIKEHFPRWIEVLAAKGTVFARMSPLEKTILIEELQAIDYHVCMCGDGANDCGALKRAHAGLSLSEYEASVAAPFTSSSNAGIECVPTLIREGRAALVTSFGMFKFMALYSVIQFCSVTILYNCLSNLSDLQYLYIDLIVIDLLALTMSRNHAHRALDKRRPPSSLISSDILVSLVVQIALQIMAQVFIFLHVQNQCWYTSLSPVEAANVTYGYNETCHELNHIPDQSNLEDEFNILTYATSAIFLLSIFIYMSVSVAFSRGRPFRTPMCMNRFFVISLLVLLAFNLFLVFGAPLEVMNFFMIRVIPDATFEIVLVTVAAMHFIAAVAFEMLIIEQSALWDVARRCCRRLCSNHVSKRYEGLLQSLNSSRAMTINDKECAVGVGETSVINPLCYVDKPFCGTVSTVDLPTKMTRL